MTREERIRELVEKINVANGTHEIIALAKELDDLLKARKKRLEDNPQAKQNSPLITLRISS